MTNDFDSVVAEVFGALIGEINGATVAFNCASEDIAKFYTSLQNSPLATWYAETKMPQRIKGLLGATNRKGYYRVRGKQRKHLKFIYRKMV